MSGALNKLRWSLQHRGFAGTLKAAANNLSRKFQQDTAPQPHPFDIKNGTDTGGLISGADLASGHSSDRFIAGYAAVPPSRFRNILARWQASDPSYALGEYTFLDIGCGKGRAALLASEYGFREVVGVELNPSLAQIAQANAELWIAAGKSRCPVRIEQGDAAEFEFPQGPCVVFLFNPFGSALMTRFTNHLAAEFQDRPTEIEMLYYKAEEAAAFAERFQMVWCETTEISPEDLAIDPVADPRDETRAFRLRKNDAPFAMP